MRSRVVSAVVVGGLLLALAGQSDAATIKTTQTPDEVKQAAEDCLTAYFGYVPEEWELEEFYQIVMDEAGNTEPDEGIGAVADVVANRCRSEKFPDTIHEVIYQKGQFQPVGDGTFGRFEVTDRVYEICADHISEGAHYPGILFFTAGRYNGSGHPAFVIGHHYFSF